jgi:hypothetical protein
VRYLSIHKSGIADVRYVLGHIWMREYCFESIHKLLVCYQLRQ